MTSPLAAALDRIRPGTTVLIPGAAGEPTAVIDALAADPGRAEGVRFVSCAIPGVNRADIAARVPNAAVEGFFVPDSARAAYEAGRYRHVPIDYSAIPAHLAAHVDLAFATVAPPKAGMVSLGVAQDLIPDLAAGRARLIGLVNPAMPPASDGILLPVDRFDALVAVDDPLVEPEPAPPGAVAAAIAGHVAGLVGDGAVVEVGIGRLGQAVLAELADRRGLSIHAGLIGERVLDLLEAGAVDAVTTGVAVGPLAFLQRAAADPRVRFRPIGHTHDAAVLAALPRFHAINFAIEVDLFGQVNAERIGPRMAGGRGGLGDFARGARRSAGGRAIVALISTAARGTVSRIVPTLSPGPVSLAYGEVDCVVTEHGAAVIAGLPVDRIAEALIAIADPAARPALAEAWQALRRRM